MTSKQAWVNLPVAVLVIGAVCWLVMQLDIQPVAAKPRRRRGYGAEEGGDDAYQIPAAQPGAKPEVKWRDQVRSPVVEHAWETLCGSIIQEVLIHR